MLKKNEVISFVLPGETLQRNSSANIAFSIDFARVRKRIRLWGKTVKWICTSVCFDACRDISNVAFRINNHILLFLASNFNRISNEPDEIVVVCPFVVISLDIDLESWKTKCRISVRVEHLLMNRCQKTTKKRRRCFLSVVSRTYTFDWTKRNSSVTRTSFGLSRLSRWRWSRTWLIKRILIDRWTSSCYTGDRHMLFFSSAFDNRFF